MQTFVETCCVCPHGSEITTQEHSTLNYHFVCVCLCVMQLICQSVSLCLFSAVTARAVFPLRVTLQSFCADRWHKSFHWFAKPCISLKFLISRINTSGISTPGMRPY